MVKIISYASASVDAVDDEDIDLEGDDFEIDFSDDDPPDSAWEWVAPVADTVDAYVDKPCEDSLTAAGGSDFSKFWLSSLVKFLRAMPTPALLVDRFCHVVFANGLCAKPGTDLGPIQGWSLLRLLGESDALKVCEAVSEVFDSGKPQVVEAVLRATGETISGRMRFGLVGVDEEKLALALLKEVRAESASLFQHAGRQAAECA